MNLLFSGLAARVSSLSALNSFISPLLLSGHAQIRERPSQEVRLTPVLVVHT